MPSHRIASALSAALIFALLGACAASVPLTPLATRQQIDYGGAARTLSVAGAEISYTDTAPEGRAPALLFIHPWAGDLRAWDLVAPRYAERFRVVRVDLPGHGRSSTPEAPWSVDLAAGAVEALIEALDLRRVTLVGNSLGGGVALAVARDRPSRIARLVLIDALGGGPVPGFFAFFIERYFRPAIFAGVDDGLIELFTQWFVFERHGEGERAFLSHLLSTRAAGDGWAWSRTVSEALRSALDYDATPWLGAIEAPTLIVQGDDDWIIWRDQADHLASAIFGAELVVLEGCGHMPELDCPAALDAALDAFLTPHAELPGGD